MTAIDPRTRELPFIGQLRCARDIRTGWHVKLGGTWRYVLSAIVAASGREVTLVLREGLHGEQDKLLPGRATFPTRTPQEQIQHIEAERIAQRGRGPVSRLHADSELLAALGDAIDAEEGSCGS